MTDMFMRGQTKASSVEQSNSQEESHARKMFPGLEPVVITGYHQPPMKGARPMQNSPRRFTNKSRTKKGTRNA